MTQDISLPGTVGPEEDLGRSIAKTVWAAKARRGVISRDVFVDTRQTNVLSVDRMDHASRREMAHIAHGRESRREGGQRFRGWAIVRSADACQNGRTVVGTPQRDNLYHADIRLPISVDAWTEVKEQKRAHALELADRARWEAAPRATPSP